MKLYKVQTALCTISACYRKNFGMKGYGFGQGGPALMSGDVSDGYGICFLPMDLLEKDEEYIVFYI